MGRSPERRNGNRLQYSCLEKFPWTEDPGRLAGSSVHGVTELEATERLSTKKNALQVLKLNTCRMMKVSCIPHQGRNSGVFRIPLSSCQPPLHRSTHHQPCQAWDLKILSGHSILLSSSFDFCSSLQRNFFSLVLYFLYRAIVLNVSEAPFQTYWSVSAWTAE